MSEGAQYVHWGLSKRWLMSLISQENARLTEHLVVSETEERRGEEEEAEGKGSGAIIKGCHNPIASQRC